MAFTNFYIQAGASDLNAGTTTSNSAAQSSTNGGWNSGTLTFTAASGTPFSGSSVGDWVSVMADASTVNTYLAQITTITGGGSGFVVSSTIKMGTAPATTSPGMTARVGGAWASPAVLNTSNLGDNAVRPLDVKVNVQAATYTRAVSDTFRFNGSASVAVWISGYNTTPGDLDNDRTDSLAKPVFAYNTTFQIASTGNSLLWSSLEVTGNVNGNLVTAGNDGACVFVRWRVTNSHTTSASCVTDQNCSWLACSFEATNALATVVNSSTSRHLGSVATGGSVGFQCANSTVYLWCIATGNATNGFQPTGSNASVYLMCTADSAGQDAFAFAQSVNFVAYGCLASNAGRYGVNYTGSGGLGAASLLACLDFYNNATANLHGVNETAISVFQQTESSSPYASGLSLLPTAAAIGTGFPGVFEHEAYSSFPAIGAVQPPGPGNLTGETAAVFFGG